RALAPAHEPGRAAAALERAARRHEPRRPARDRARGAGRVRRLRPDAAAREARPHRPLAGERTEPDRLPGARAPGSRLRRGPLAAAGSPDPAAHRAGGDPPARRPVRRRARDWGTLAVCAYAFLIPLQPVLTMPDGSPLRFAAADLAAPLVFVAALARPRHRLPRGLALLAVAIPVLAFFATLWAGLDRSLSYYALGKTAGLAYL